MRTIHNKNNYHNLEIKITDGDYDKVTYLDYNIKNLLAKFLGKKSLLSFMTVNKGNYKDFFFAIHQRIKQNLIFTGWIILEEEISLTPATTQRTLNQLMLHEVASLFFTNPQQTQFILNSLLNYRKKGYHFETALAREVYAFFKRQKQNQRDRFNNSTVAILYKKIKIDQTREKFEKDARVCLPEKRATLICFISLSVCFLLLFIALMVFVIQKNLDTSTSAPLALTITGLALLLLGSLIPPLLGALETYCIRRSAQMKAIHCSTTISRIHAALNDISITETSKRGVKNLKAKMHDSLLLKNAALVQKFTAADSFPTPNYC